MPTYIVRLIKNRDLVGFFAADDMDDLVTAVDECTDPDACEYIELPAGGVMWESPAIAVPLDPGQNEDGSDCENLPWADVTISEAWWGTLYGYSDEEWTPLFPDLSGGPEDPNPDDPDPPMGPGMVMPFRRKKR